MATACSKFINRSYTTVQVCSGVKVGGEQRELLRNPSAPRVRHEFPSPIPSLTALLTMGNPIPAERFVVVLLKKNCCSGLVSPSPTARPPKTYYKTHVREDKTKLTAGEKTRASAIVDVSSTVNTSELLTRSDNGPAAVYYIIMLSLKASEFSVLFDPVKHKLTLTIRSNFCPAIVELQGFKAIGTRLKRKSPVRKSETSKQVSGDATFLIWTPVAARTAVVSNVGPSGQHIRFYVTEIVHDKTHQGHLQAAEGQKSLERLR